MSYYKIKAISFREKENKVFVTAADSSLRPLQYIRSEYAAATPIFREKVESLWENVMTGNFQLIPSCRWCKAANEAFAKKRTISNGMDVLGYDFKYKTSFTEELNAYVIKTYLTPTVMKEIIVADAQYEDNFVDRSRNQWHEIADEMRRNHQIPIRSALFSTVFRGWDVLYPAFSNKLIVAKCSNYNHGLLDNKDQSAVILPEDSGFDWPEVAYADLDSLSEVLKKYPELIPLCVIEAEYQSAERAVTDGYQKICDDLYAIKTKGRISYAKIIGY